MAGIEFGTWITPTKPLKFEGLGEVGAIKILKSGQDEAMLNYQNWVQNKMMIFEVE